MSWLGWLDSLFKDRIEGMDFKLVRLSPTYRKQEQPACAVCGYDAEWLVGLDSLERLFCERDLQDAFLDVFNFNYLIPDIYSA